MSDTKQHKPNTGLVICEDIRQQLPAYMLRELGDKQSRLIHEHLRVCDPCRKEAAHFEKMQVLLRDQQHLDADAAAVLSEKHMQRLRFTAMHPVYDWIYYRHRFVSCVCAVILISLVVFLLRNFALFREPSLEDTIPVWQMFRSERLTELLEKAAEVAEEDP